MKISELLEKLVTANLIPSDPHRAWESFTEAVLALDLQGQSNFSDAATELFDTHATLIWSELGGEGSPNVNRPSVAIARSQKSAPRIAIERDNSAPLDCAGLQLMILDALDPITDQDISEMFEGITVHVESERQKLGDVQRQICEAITAQFSAKAEAIAANFQVK